MKIEISANWELPFSYDGVVLPIHQTTYTDSFRSLDAFSYDYNLNLTAALRTIQVYVPGCKRLRVVEK